MRKVGFAKTNIQICSLVTGKLISTFIFLSGLVGYPEYWFSGIVTHM